MQGRQGPGGNGKFPQDRSSTSSFRLSELSDRQPTVPKRPPGMRRVDTPPSTPRVARPEREDPKEPKRRGWKWWSCCLGSVIILGIIAFVIVYGATNLFAGLGDASDSANTATDFLSSLKTQNYDQAYHDLDSTLTTDNLKEADFVQKARAADTSYGQVTDYNEVPDSAVKGTNTYTYTYNITRSKCSSTYPLKLTIQKNNADGKWYITDYGGDLGPPASTCK